MQHLAFVLFFLAALALPSCQSSTDSSTSSVADLGALPKATSAVTGLSTAVTNSLFTASTGVKLKESHSAGWGATKSRPMCEVSRILRETYFHAATPDMILCVISAMSNNGGFGPSIYDGSYKHFILDGNVGETKLKFNVVKTDAAITSFNLFMCQSDDGTNYTQTGYVGQDLSDNSNVTMNSVFKATISGNTYGARSDVTGAINSSGAWSRKQITSTTTSSNSSKTFTSRSTVDQYDDRVQLDSFMTGAYANDTFENRLYSIVQILSADSLSTFAIGDGSARYLLNFSRTGSNSQAFDNTKSWTGDTRFPVDDAEANGAYHSSVKNKTPRLTSAVTVDFEEAETWTCTAGEGQFSEIVFTNISAQLVTDVAACLTTYAGSTRDYIDCYSATGE